MKILNKKILNKAATFLLMAVLLCCNAVQVEAEERQRYDASIVSRDYSVYPTIIGSVENHNVIVTTYETELQFVAEPLEPGYTYYNWGNFNLSYYVDYSTESQVTYLNCITDVKSVKMSVAGEEDIFLDFYYNDPITVSILNGTSGRYNRDFYIEPFLNGYYVDAYVDVVFTVTLQHYVWHDISGADYSIISGLTSNNTVPFMRLPGNYSYTVGNVIVAQNETLLGRLTSWFDDLFKRMDDKQNELIHGYQDTTTSEAASAFSSESDKLTALEGELSMQSNTYVTDYAAEGFDLGVLATIGSSLIFVTTWFTNFWNIGGVFTACLNFCFALSIVFFILRIKR